MYLPLVRCLPSSSSMQEHDVHDNWTSGSLIISSP